MPIDYTKRPAAGAPAAPPAPTPAQPVPAASPAAAPSGPVRLTKSAPTVSLTKSGQASGVLRVNLNWNARPPGAAPGGGFLKRMAAAAAPAIDLDLACLYEFADGRTGVVQALGNAFRDGGWGEPICWLDGDDRSGANSAGENLFVNLAQLPMIRRVLVFAFIYEGVPNWAAADGVVTLYPAQGAPLEVRLDEPGAQHRMCAIALLENRGGELSVSRQVRYFGGHREIDQAYGWGLQWTAGRK